MSSNKTDSTPIRRRGVLLGLAGLGSALALSAAVAVPATAEAGHHRTTDYVALGDSLASGPGIPDQVDANCARSSSNYPSLVAADRHTHLTDVSCSGATTAAMTEPLRTAPAQFDALNRGTDLVTISIGVNDIGFSTIIGTCAQVGATDPTGSPCRAYFGSSGTDQLQQNIDATAPKISQVLAGIHRKAPHAKVLVLGYPDLLPDDGVGCTSATVPFAGGDFAYLRDTEKSLNSMLSRQAHRGGAQYVDTYKPTIGHDMCKPVGQRWIEPVGVAAPVAPAHPNALGHQAMAKAVERTLGHRVLTRH
jgi:lysophospholipase L1-like esterase